MCPQLPFSPVAVSCVCPRLPPVALVTVPAGSTGGLDRCFPANFGTNLLASRLCVSPVAPSCPPRLDCVCSAIARPVLPGLCVSPVAMSVCVPRCPPSSASTVCVPSCHVPSCHPVPSCPSASCQACVCPRCPPSRLCLSPVARSPSKSTSVCPRLPSPGCPSRRVC